LPSSVSEAGRDVDDEDAASLLRFRLDRELRAGAGHFRLWLPVVGTGVVTDVVLLFTE